MTADIHTLTGAYATDALPDDEQRMFQRHLDECDACAQEVRELQATVARLAGGVALVPPPRLEARVLAEIATVRQLPPERDVPGLGDNVVPLRRPWYRSVAGIAAAGLLFLSLGLGGVVLREQARVSDARATTQAIGSVLADPSRVLRTVPISEGGTATVVSAHGHAVFTASGLPGAGPGRTYQLWVVAGPERVRSAGLLSLHDGVTEAYVAAVDPSSTLAVTVEPAGGSKQPTTQPIVKVPSA